MSLQVLLPGYNGPRSSPSPPANDPASQTASELIQLSSVFEEAINNERGEQLAALTRRHISPTFTARFDTAFIESWAEYVALMRRWTKANPNYQNSIIATEAEVEEEGREATVYILMELTGWPVELKRYIVSVLKWKKRRRTWLCYENVTMRGIDTFATGSG